MQTRSLTKPTETMTYGNVREREGLYYIREVKINPTDGGGLKHGEKCSSETE